MRLEILVAFFIGVDFMGEWQTVMGKRIYIGLEDAKVSKHVIPRNDSVPMGGHAPDRVSEIPAHNDPVSVSEIAKQTKDSFRTFTNKKGRSKANGR
jgi:hypothetical protein